MEAGIGAEFVVSKPCAIVTLLVQSLVLIIPDVSLNLCCCSTIMDSSPLEPKAAINSFSCTSP